MWVGVGVSASVSVSVGVGVGVSVSVSVSENLQRRALLSGRAEAPVAHSSQGRLVSW